MQATALPLLILMMTSLSLFLILGFMRFAMHSSLLQAYKRSHNELFGQCRDCVNIIIHSATCNVLGSASSGECCVCVCWMHFPNEFCIIVLISTGSLIGSLTETKNWIVDYVIRLIWNAVHWWLLQPHKHNTERSIFQFLIWLRVF